MDVKYEEEISVYVFGSNAGRRIIAYSNARSESSRKYGNTVRN